MTILNIVITFLVINLVAILVGYTWHRYSLSRVNIDQEVKTKNLLYSRWQVMAGVIIALALAYSFSWLVAGILNASMLKTSSTIPVSQEILEQLDYERDGSFNQDIRLQLQQEMSEIKEGKMWLYEEFVKTLFAGEVPAEFEPREENIGFQILRNALRENQVGGKGIDTNQMLVHSEFISLFSQLEIASNFLSRSEARREGDNEQEVSNFLLYQESLVPLPKAFAIFPPNKANPRTYLRNGQSNLVVWAELMEFGRSQKSAEEVASQITLWNTYVSFYMQLFTEDLRIAYLLLGPIQLSLYALFFMAIILLTKRIFLTKNEKIMHFVNNSFSVSSNHKGWDDFLDTIQYVPVNYVLWAIPSIGFIGTVLGISQSLAKAYLVVMADGKAEQALAVGKVTELLSLAFDTTLVALVLNVFVMALYFFARANESRLLYQ